MKSESELGYTHPVVTEDLSRIATAVGSALGRLSGKTILVAGAAGFLPSYVVDALAFGNEVTDGAPCQIVCVDNFKTGLPDRLAHLDERSDVSFLKHDITQPLGSISPDFIINGASIASPTWYRKFPLETIDINVGGTRMLLDLARSSDVEGFLYLSSSEIYGDPPPDQIPTKESYWGHVSCTGPRACYDESKRLAETLCMTYHRSFDVPVKIVRPFNVYGPRLRLDDGRIVPDLMSDVLAERPVTLYSDGSPTRSFCYVSDAAAGIIEILASDVAGEAFNLGNDEEVSIRELVETVDELSGNGLGVRTDRSEDPEYVTDNPQRRCPDLEKVKEMVGWSPSVSLREGMERTLRYYREGGR
jgi:dTDP-glucose 4,6-dehydratase/UDP-glucuronate decarboxylase